MSYSFFTLRKGRCLFFFKKKMPFFVSFFLRGGWIILKIFIYFPVIFERTRTCCISAIIKFTDLAGRTGEPGANEQCIVVNCPQ